MLSKSFELDCFRSCIGDFLKKTQVVGSRDHEATLGLGGGTINDSILGGGTKHFFLLILYNFQNIGGARAPPAPYSAVPG